MCSMAGLYPIDTPMCFTHAQTSVYTHTHTTDLLVAVQTSARGRARLAPMDPCRSVAAKPTPRRRRGHGYMAYPGSLFWRSPLLGVGVSVSCVRAACGRGWQPSYKHGQMLGKHRPCSGKSRTPFGCHPSCWDVQTTPTGPRRGSPLFLPACRQRNRQHRVFVHYSLLLRQLGA